jgi:hypothetical protein
MRDDKYWPRGIEEVEEKVSLINEPLARLELRGVYVPRADQRQVVRELYVATRRQRFRE